MFAYSSANEITLIQVNDGQNSKENESKHSILAFVQAHKFIEDSLKLHLNFDTSTVGQDFGSRIGVCVWRTNIENIECHELKGWIMTIWPKFERVFFSST